MKLIKIVLISRRLLQNPCESYLYPSTKYICIIPLVSLYLPWFRFVSQNRISPLNVDNANSLAATHRRRPHCVYLTPMSDQDKKSPYGINAISTREVMRTISACWFSSSVCKIMYWCCVEKLFVDHSFEWKGKKRGRCHE